MSDISGEELQELVSHYNEHKWATEATLDSILSDSKNNTAVIVSAIKSISGIEIDLTQVRNSSRRINRAMDIRADAKKQTDKVLGAISRDSDPIGGMTELMAMGADMTAGALDKLQDFVIGKKNASKVFKFMSASANRAGPLMLAATTLFGKLATDQEKTARGMIDLGLASNGLTGMTDMRKAAADLGQSLDELVQKTSGAESMLISFGGDKTRGFEDFFKTVVKIEKTMENGVGDFGYSIGDMTQRFADEATMLHGLGMLAQDEQLREKQITDAFRMSSGIFTALAGITGDQRSDLLAKFQQTMEDADFQYAMIKNNEFVMNNFGEQAAENIRQSSGVFDTFLKSTFGENDPITKELIEARNRGLSNIHLDQTVLNDLGPALQDKLSAMPPAVREQILKMMNDSITGNMTGVDMLAENQELLRKIQTDTGSAMPVVVGSKLEGLASMYAAWQKLSFAVPTNFLNMNRAELEELIKSGEFQVETADSIVDATDNMKVAFRQIMNKLEPSFETSGTVIENFADLIDNAGDLIGKVFGVEYVDPRKMADREEQILKEAQMSAIEGLSRIQELERKREEQGGKLASYDRNELTRLKRNEQRMRQMANAQIIRRDNITVDVAIQESTLLNKASAASATKTVQDLDIGFGRTETYRLMDSEYFTSTPEYAGPYGNNLPKSMQWSMNRRAENITDLQELVREAGKIVDPGTYNTRNHATLANFSATKEDYENLRNAESRQMDLLKEKQGLSSIDPRDMERLQKLNEELTKLDAEMELYQKNMKDAIATSVATAEHGE